MNFLCNLKYNEIYKLSYGKKDCLGIYLGKYNKFSRHAGKHLFLVDKSIKRWNQKFLITRFESFRYDKENKLVLQKTSIPKIPYFQNLFYKDLVFSKLRDSN